MLVRFGEDRTQLRTLVQLEPRGKEMTELALREGYAERRSRSRWSNVLPPRLEGQTEHRDKNGKKGKTT
jgi:hypothetical protein